MRSLTLKLTLAFLGVSLAGIALVAALVWGISSLEFNRFVVDRGLNRYASAAAAYYAENGSWAGVDKYMRVAGILSGPGQTGGQGQGQGQGQNNPSLPPLPFVLTDANRVVILGVGHFRAGETLPALPADRNIKTVDVTVNGQVVGYVISTGSPRPDIFESRYLQRMNLALILAALVAVILSVGLGLLVTRNITRPVLELTSATSAVAQGKHNQPVPVRSRDEIGQLTRSFNQMSADLERSNNLRKQMTADIAHDLRTPLSVIAGYLEGLKEGVLKPTQARFSAMYDEAVYLQRLVEDLRTLSLADAGELSIQRQPVQPGELLERLAAAYSHQAEAQHITLRADISPELPAIQVDPERMLQALGNLINNALRYTNEQGEIFLSAKMVEMANGGAANGGSSSAVALEVRDTGCGIDPEVLPHVFERFYRGDSSRQDGGTGLGLAIARSIVELHGGKILAASPGPGLGSQFTILIPC